MEMATQPENDVLPTFPPSRPNKMTYLAGAVLFVLFAIFVMAQPVVTPETQQAAAAAKKTGLAPK
jgi:hypothetical protein